MGWKLAKSDKNRLKIAKILIFLIKHDEISHFLFNFVHVVIKKPIMGKNEYKNRIRVILADRQVTNRALADKLDVSEMTISRWVTNRFQPSMSQFVEISKILNVDIKDLIEIDPSEISGLADDDDQFYARIEKQS